MKPAALDVARPTVTLAHLPAVLTLAEYAREMRQSVRTVRRELAAGCCRVPPCLVRPYRWRRVDLELHLSTATVTADRRRLMRLAAPTGTPARRRRGATAAHAVLASAPAAGSSPVPVRPPSPERSR